MSIGQNSRVAEAVAAFRRGELNLARALAQAQVDSDEGHAEARHLLGLIDCREGQLEKGVVHLQRAVDAQPDNPAFRVMLARALIDSGRPREALDAAVAPKTLSPAALALWHVRAEAAKAAKDYRAGVEAWAIVSTTRPDDWRAWAGYGEALAGLERWEDAANAFRRSRTLNPGELSLQQNFSAALMKSGFYAEAAEQLRLMLDRWPSDSSIRLTLARLLADLGKHEESMAELDTAARLAVGDKASGEASEDLIRIALPDRTDPSQPLSDNDLRALGELALLLERTSRMDALRRLLADAEKLGIGREQLSYPAAAIALRDGDSVEAKRLLESEEPTRDPVRHFRLLAKILDTSGDYAGAFNAAISMNRAVPDFAAWTGKGSDYRRRVRTLAETVDAAWAARLRPLQPGPRRSPAFLVGFPRSGTTLLDTFLMGHPDTQVLEEFHMLGAAETVLGNVAHLPDRSPDQLDQARRAYFAELDRHVDGDFAGLVVDKLPLNMLGLPVIYSLFPDAKVIFAQRHPCDCVLSGFMQSFTLNDAMACFLTIEGAAELYDVAMQMFCAGRDGLPLAVHRLVYEQLVANPEAELRPLIGFLGLEWRPELLDHRATAKARGAIITPSYDQVVQPLTKAPSGRWRRYAEQLEPVLPTLLPWARQLGYEN
jgi:tetratricopeptide (TPR) repeat protein